MFGVVVFLFFVFPNDVSGYLKGSKGICNEVLSKSKGGILFSMHCMIVHSDYLSSCRNMMWSCSGEKDKVHDTNDVEVRGYVMRF